MSTWIKSVIESFSYPGIVFLMLLETVFPPIPSELVLPLSGFVSTQGRLSPWGVIVAATVGALAGALALYYIGRRVGPKRLERWVSAHGKWIGLSPKDLDRSDRLFRQHGAKTVFLGRLVPGIRSLISIPAGVAKMPLAPFVLYTAAGSAVWSAALVFAGRMLGRNYEQVEHVVGPISTAVVVGILLSLLIRGFRMRHNPGR